MWGFTKFNFKLNLKVSAFYLEKQKSFIPKKICFWPYRQDTSKRWRVPSQFSRRFWYNHIMNCWSVSGRSKVGHYRKKYYSEQFPALMMGRKALSAFMQEWPQKMSHDSPAASAKIPLIIWLLIVKPHHILHFDDSSYM